VINALLNPKRTKQQLYESSVKRRTAELLMKEDSEAINIDELFDRFNGKCFKTGQLLDKNNRGSWAVDHILPSKWLYPLSISNAALLSTEANANKSDMWPSKFYSNEELKNLAEIAGANLALISRKDPIINENIDVDACVGRFLTVRSATDLEKRIEGLHKLLEDYGLSDRLSDEHKKMLGLS
jgi:CRISPR/Cas system Type II protein with McrA/HNH and RuvC-like nuclease domain